MLILITNKIRIMISIQDKIEILKEFLEENKRFTFSDWDQLALNIKGSYYYDNDFIEKELLKEYKQEFINSLNLEMYFEDFFNNNVERFFDYAKELLKEKWYKYYKVYQSWRSGGYLYIDKLYQDIEDYIENLEYSLDNEEITKKDAHEEIKEYLELIKDIEEIFTILKKYCITFEKNIDNDFLDNLKDIYIKNHIENLESKIKENNILINNIYKNEK